MRLSERHRFKLAVIANLDGESEATMVERAIDQMGKGADLGDENWDTLWDEEEAVRWLRVFAMPHYRSRKTSGGAGLEAELLKFLNAHAQWFWADKSKKKVRHAHAVILWPHRWELEKKWRKTKETDYFAASRDMAAILKKADPSGKLQVPDFG